jgi:hypothetical protein
LIQQFEMQGFRVAVLTVTTLGILEQVVSVGISVREYRARVELRPYATMMPDRIVAAVRDAAEGSGSYTPAVSIPSLGQSAQPDLQSPSGALGAAVSAVQDALGGIGALPREVATVSKLLIVGVVVLVGFVAFGPNVQSIARAARP